MQDKSKSSPAALPGGSTLGVKSNSERLLPPAAPPFKRAFTTPIPSSVNVQESFVQRFVPDMVVERLFNGGAIQAQELSRYQQTVVGFFDVSGFSALARDLEQADKTRSEMAMKKRSASSFISQHSYSGKGAEELVRQLNETLSVLIETIRIAGGDIIKFAGDAILVVWLCDESKGIDAQLLRATECAVACCALKSDQSKLRLHVGIGCGELVAAHVGGTFGRWEFFIAGEACTQSALAADHAKVNEVVMSLHAIEITRKSAYLKVIEGNEVEDRFFLVTKLEYQNLGPAPSPRYSLSNDPNVAKAAEGYVPGPVRDALKSGGSTSASVGGLRKLTVIFFKLYDVNLPSKFDPEMEKLFLEQCQNQAKLVQDSAYHYYATLRQFILDDKGFVAIVALGLPPFFHEDNAVRAVKVAKRLIEHHKVKATAGICTGTVFCGVVGSSKRAEYSIAGSCINLAARLMAKASPGTIWCDSTTKQEAENIGHIKFQQFPSLPFKGFNHPVEIFGPVMNSMETPPAALKNGSAPPAELDPPHPEVLNIDGVKKSPGTSSQAKSGDAQESGGGGSHGKKQKKLLIRTDSRRPVAFVGFEQELSTIARAAFVPGTTASSVRACFVEGEAGSGKTRVCEWVLKETSARRSILSAADSSETNTPFFVWRSILQSVLAFNNNNPNSTRQSTANSMQANSSFTFGPAPGVVKEKPISSLTQHTRKRGFSSEDAVGPSMPPQPVVHRRNRSHESGSISPAAARQLLPDVPESAPVGVHKRVPSSEQQHIPLPSAIPTHVMPRKSQTGGESPSPLRKEVARGERVDSMFGDLDHASDEGGDSSSQDSLSSTNDDRVEATNSEEADSQQPGNLLTDAPTGTNDSGLIASVDAVLTAPPPPHATGAGLRVSADPSIATTTGRPSALSNYLPERSAVLESLQDAGKLRGRRLSCLHAILPNLVIPPELDSGPSAVPPTTSTTAAAAASAPQTFTTMLAARLGTPQRKTSMTSVGKTFGSGPPPSTASTIVSGSGGGGLAGDTLSEAQASMEIVMLLLEECGLQAPTLIVIESAQFMDKQSWELLKRCCEMNPPSWKGEHRVRFVVAFRPFAAPKDHPLNLIVSPLHTTSSLLSMVGSPIIPVTTGATAPPPLPPLGSGTQGGAIPPPPAFERVSSTLSAIAQHATRRRSVEGTYNVTSRTSGSEAVRSEAQVTETENGEPQVIKVIMRPMLLRETGVFLSSVLKVAIGPHLLDFIYKKSRGNPRSIIELFKALQDQDLIRFDPKTGMVEETTSLQDISDTIFVIPLHIRALLQQEIDKLLQREQLILKLASVAGIVMRVTILRWLYSERVATTGHSSTTQSSTSLATAVEAGVNGEVTERNKDVDDDFNAGLLTLFEKGFLRPVGYLNHKEVDAESDDDADLLSFEDWYFVSDHVRYVVYSQMLHTARREVHGLVLDWYATNPQQRTREDPAFLGNHAIGAERLRLAFHGFKEGLRRAVLKEEMIIKGERLWQSCIDLLDDPTAEFSSDVVQAYKVVVDVLMGQVCIMNEAWVEAESYLNRAISAYQALILTHPADKLLLPLPDPFNVRRKSVMERLKTMVSAMNCASKKDATSAMMPTLYYRGEMQTNAMHDPFKDAEKDPMMDSRSYALVAQDLLKKMQVMQETQLRLVNSLKGFSVYETAVRE